jgi:DHA1 family multidrug resistance protein-like MFS transporter
MPFKAGMLGGLGLYAASMALMLLTPAGGMAAPLLVLSSALEAVALAVLSPLTSSMLFINADPEERARVCGLVYATLSLIIVIFPGLIGILANISLRIPFVICIGLFGFAAVLTLVLSRLPAQNPEE